MQAGSEWLSCLQLNTLIEIQHEFWERNVCFSSKTFFVAARAGQQAHYFSLGTKVGKSIFTETVLLNNAVYES